MRGPPDGWPAVGDGSLRPLFESNTMITAAVGNFASQDFDICLRKYC